MGRTLRGTGPPCDQGRGDAMKLPSYGLYVNDGGSLHLRVVCYERQAMELERSKLERRGLRVATLSYDVPDGKGGWRCKGIGE